MAAKAQSTPEGITIGNETNGTDLRQMCKYGSNCYQKNPMHHQKFRHPVQETCDTIAKPNRLQEGSNQKENMDENKRSNSNIEGNEKTTMQYPSPKKAKLLVEKNTDSQVNTLEIF